MVLDDQSWISPEARQRAIETSILSVLVGHSPTDASLDYIAQDTHSWISPEARQRARETSILSVVRYPAGGPSPMFPTTHTSGTEDSAGIDVVLEPQQKTRDLSVLMVTPFYITGGGVGTVSKELSDKLREKGAMVDVLRWWPVFQENHDSSPVLFESNGMQTRLNSLDCLLSLSKEYDVVHFQSDAFTDAGGGRLSDLLSHFGAKSVFTVHCLSAYHKASMNEGSNFDKHIINQLEMMQMTDRTVLLTQDLKDIASGYHPEHGGKYAVVPNGINIPKMVSGGEARLNELRQSYGISPDEKVLLYMSRLSIEKGVIELAQAFPKIKRHNPDLRLVIAGNKANDLSGRMRQDLNAAGLVEGRDYNFVGWVDGEKRELLYKLSDFVILPSRYEHMPMSALEAMARKRPVIMTDVESVRNLFNAPDKKSRLVYPITRKADPQAIVRAVDYALRHPREMRLMANRAYHRASRDFTLDVVADQYIDLYNSLVDGRRCKRTCSLEDSKTRMYREAISAIRVRLATDKFDQEQIGYLQGLAEKLRKHEVPHDGPEVTAVMPVYLKPGNTQGLSYLFEAIASFLKQDFDKSSQLVIVDDCSPLDVASKITERYFGDISLVKDEDGKVLYTGRGKIKIIKKKTNTGSGDFVRHIGYLEALKDGSKYITHIDDDDRMAPDMLRTLYQHLEVSPATDMVHGSHVSIDSYGNPLNPEGNDVDRFFNFLRQFVIMDGADPRASAEQGRVVRFGENQLDELNNKANLVHNGAAMFRSNVLYRIGLNNLVPTERYGGDQQFWQKLSRVATIDYLNKSVIEYRQHSNSMSANAR